MWPDGHGRSTGSGLVLPRAVVRDGHLELDYGSEGWGFESLRARHLHWLGIDVWTDNSGLHNYYLHNGFKHVRTLDLADYPSGALFQRPADSAN
jgi:hypothetical protein